MNHYYTSTGERISKSTIDRKIREAKQKKIDQQKEEYGYNFCEECEASGSVRLDCSHEKSVNDCQRDRESEKAWDVNNIKIRCRKCHQKHDKIGLWN